MNIPTTAIDISNYTGELGSKQLAYLDEHAAFVIVRLSTEDQDHQRTIAAQQVYALADARIPWQGYLWCYWDMDPFEHWQRATELLPMYWPGYYQLGIWLDMEDPCGPAWHAQEWVGAYAEILARDEFVPGVYTGRWWIEQHREVFTSQRARYWQGYPLWFASYGVEPACKPIGCEPWVEVAMHQYQSVQSDGPLRAFDISHVCTVY